MKYVALVLLCVLAACNARTGQMTLQEGTWTGHLTPMNHPDMHTPVIYDVRGTDSLTISLNVADTSVPVRAIQLEGDTLAFVFNEPEADVLLTCALARQADDSYAGRCADGSGKWAHFTMLPPEE